MMEPVITGVVAGFFVGELCDRSHTAAGDTY